MAGLHGGQDHFTLVGPLPPTRATRSRVDSRFRGNDGNGRLERPYSLDVPCATAGTGKDSGSRRRPGGPLHGVISTRFQPGGHPIGAVWPVPPGATGTTGTATSYYTLDDCFSILKYGAIGFPSAGPDCACTECRGTGRSGVRWGSFDWRLHPPVAWGAAEGRGGDRALPAGAPVRSGDRARCGARVARPEGTTGDAGR